MPAAASKTHSLCTTDGHPPLTHAVRLLPGDDVLTALLEYVNTREIAAAVVVACVGSTGKTTLRPAGGADVQIFEGAHEIVSLSGTIGVGGTPDGSIHGGVDGEMHHLHMAISDSTCSVVGGHVMPGCIVRTTAEIVLLEIDGLAFTRPHDPTTGYAELSITERIATSKLQAGMPVLVIGAALLLGLVIGQGTR